MITLLVVFMMMRRTLLRHDHCRWFWSGWSQSYWGNQWKESLRRSSRQTYKVSSYFLTNWLINHHQIYGWRRQRSWQNWRWLSLKLRLAFTLFCCHLDRRSRLRFESSSASLLIWHVARSYFDVLGWTTQDQLSVKHILLLLRFSYRYRSNFRESFCKKF